MPTKHFRDLMASARSLHGADEATIDRFLDGRQIRDLEVRIALKLELRAQGELGTDQDHPRGTLATDLRRHTPAQEPVSGAMQTMLRRAGLDLTRAYAEAEVDTALAGAEVRDVVSRIALKMLLSERGCLRR